MALTQPTDDADQPARPGATGSQPANAPTPLRPRTGSAAPADPAAQQAELARKLLAAVPERPKLAPGVSTAGQMQESAFKDPPWLIEREGEGFVQVTRLLYLIAEQANGQHTLQDIAQAVSKQYGRTVSEDNVRQLVASQLLAKGLVLTADGRSLAPVGGSSGARSPLRLNMKTRTIPGEVITPIARVFTPLYWPPVLIGILLLAAATEVYTYAIHGVGASLHDVIYQPGLMVVLLAVVIVSAAFHEFGHAAAMTYSGGRVREMGAGMYLVYPAFFTDISDNYRLPRGARVRTDLGGFYFNMIFALGVMALYVLTHQEFLLLIIVLINFDIIHQLLPFVRLDGYWALADLTGLPDFFTQMGSFVRSVVPGLKLKGRKLPELHWWARLVFTVYILVTIPLLALLLFATLRSLPRIVATALSSLGQQAHGFQQAQQAGNVLNMLGAAGQTLLLILPLAGLAFTLYSVGRMVFGWVRSWAKDSPARRAIAAAGGLAAAALLVLMWLPSLPLGIAHGRTSPLYAQDTYRPFQADERYNLADAAGSAYTHQQPAPAYIPAFITGPQPTAQATPQGTATAVGTPQATPQATPQGTPLPLVVGGTPTATPPAVGTPIPAQAVPTSGTPTPTLPPALPTLAATRTPATAPAAPVLPPAPVVAPTSTPTPAADTGLSTPMATDTATPTSTPARAATPPAYGSPTATPTATPVF